MIEVNNDWLEYLPSEIRQELSVFTGPCRAVFKILVDKNPIYLVNLIKSNLLDSPQLTFATEILGIFLQDLAKSTLVSLLDHESSLVIEGALLGLKDHCSFEYIEKLKNIKENHKSTIIKELANDAIDDLEWLVSLAREKSEESESSVS